MITRPALSAFLLAAFSLAACGPDQPEAEAVNAELTVLFPDDPGRRGLGALDYAGGLILTGGGEDFGGWSAMEISEDGRRLLAISDSATWMTADLAYGPSGDLSGLSRASLTAMRDEAGGALTGARADAEGLAHMGEGRYAVSFERSHRIAVYEIGEDWSQIGEAPAQTFPAPPGADRLRANAGLEALARLGDTLWAGVEYPIIDGQPATLWRYDLERADAPPQSAALALTPGFGLTGLAPDGAGGLIVVERYWSRDVGNRIKIGHLRPDALDAGNGPLTPEPLALIEPDMTVDNIEAVALAEIDGERRIFVMSDDNFNDAQRTLLLSFVWPRD